MVAIAPFLAFSLVAAVVALLHARRHRRTLAPQRVPLHAVATRDAVGRRTPALARIGRIGDVSQPDPVRAMVSIANPADGSAVLEVLAADGTELAHVRTGAAVMARGWSRGHLVLGYGETRREYGPSWALGPAMAGWELHLVTTDGRVLRCYGAPGSVMDDDLARLGERVRTAVLADAS